jgi:hypothetical protein
MILVYRDRPQPLVDTTTRLDLLTPQRNGVQRAYAEYVRFFEERLKTFFPAV